MQFPFSYGGRTWYINNGSCPQNTNIEKIYMYIWASLEQFCIFTFQNRYFF